MDFIEWLRQPWPWYIAGPLIGLTVPFLLLIGNKSFGVSSSLRHVCAVLLPANIKFFKYDWKKEIWNLFFAAGIICGAFIVSNFLANPQPPDVDPDLVIELQQYGISNFTELMPPELFNWKALLSGKGIIMIIVGGFLVGFGTRYAGGCTSGHAIMGLSTMQLPSLIATLSFMAGGFIVANLVLPFILKL